MARNALVETAKSKGLVLTRSGAQASESVVRRHRIAKRMVVDLLGLEPHKAHVEAHRLEHAISPEVEALIDERLGQPTTCPIGHPIPGSSYVPARDAAPLDEVSLGGEFIVDRVPDDDQALPKYFLD
jgi:DtxR family Mn-dependent transcriptional regulator